MKTRKSFFYLLAAFLCGCVPSLHPLYTDKELIFDEKLLGVWGSSVDNYWQFEEGSDPNSYDLTVVADEKEGEFSAHLVKIDQMLFLDLFPEEPNLQACDFYKIHLLSVHTFIKVEQVGPTLQLRMMNADTLDKMLKSDPNLIKHETVDGRVVLTASMQLLQQFMRNHANDKEMFGESEDMERMEPNNLAESSLTEPNEIIEDK